MINLLKNGELYKMILMIDNYDSFTYNVVQYCMELGANLKAIRNDELTVTEIRALNPEKIIISPGPATPNEAGVSLEVVKRFHKDTPIFGICLGHQLLSIAHGYDTYKLKFGHHGGNHPVKNEINSVVEITAQNHNYNVPDNIIEVATVTHTNLFDNTIEGLRYNDSPSMSVQHHPEASPGPHESKYIFTQFANSVK